MISSYGDKVGVHGRFPMDICRVLAVTECKEVIMNHGDKFTREIGKIFF